MKKRVLVLPILFLLASVSCMDLDTFIAPAIFNNVSYSNAQPYLLGNFNGGEFYTQISSVPAWSDAILFDNITNTYNQYIFISGTNNIYSYYMQHLIGGTGRTILFFHGNYHSMDNYWGRAKLLFNTGADVFMMDYRGYGKSQGEPTEQGLFEDAEASLVYLTNTLGVARTNIMIYGYSLGSVPACHVAAYGHMDSALGLVLEAPIGSVEIFIQDATFLPIHDSYLTGYRLDNVSAIQDVSVPLVWIHGQADMSQRWDTHGQAVYDHHGGSLKWAKLVPGSAHSQSPLVMDPDFSDYIDGISNFISDQTVYPFP